MAAASDATRLVCRFDRSRDHRHLGAALAVVVRAMSLSIHAPTIPPLQPITTERLWIAGIWLFYWPLKILGEELACVVCCCRAWSCGLGDMRGP
jgi:hypothetical protein